MTLSIMYFQIKQKRQIKPNINSFKSDNNIELCTYLKIDFEKQLKRKKKKNEMVFC